MKSNRNGYWVSLFAVLASAYLAQACANKNAQDYNDEQAHRALALAAREKGTWSGALKGSNGDAIAAIQKRSDELLKEKVAPHPTAGAMHDQKGGHGGGIGLCPVYVPEGATASAKTDKKGAPISIKAPAYVEPQLVRKPHKGKQD